MSRKMFAGDVYTVECPSAYTGPLGVGQSWIYEGKTAATVLKIEGSKIVLGPVAGIVEVPFDCSDGSKVPVMYEIQGLEAARNIEMHPPLGVLSIPFPWFVLWYLLLSILLGAGATVLVRKWRHLKFSKKSKKVKAKKPDAAQVLDQWLSLDSTRQVLEKDQTSSETIKEFFAVSQHALRTYLQFCFEFDSAASTTPEFIGDLRVAVTHKAFQKPGWDLIAQVEGALVISDRTRFAFEHPSLSVRGIYREQIQQIRRNCAPLYEARKALSAAVPVSRTKSPRSMK